MKTLTSLAALTRTSGIFRDEEAAPEPEGQVGKYFDSQHHLEFNIPVAARWHRLPWDADDSDPDCKIYYYNLNAASQEVVPGHRQPRG